MSEQRRNATVFPYRGKWRIQYLDIFGRSRTMTAESQQDAYRKLSEIEGKIRTGFLQVKKSEIPSVGAWLDYWLAHKKPDWNPTTHWSYESSARKWLRPALGALRMDTVTVRQLQDFYGYLQNQHNLANGTVRRIHSSLSSAFSLALKQGVISHNPVLNVVQPKFIRKPIETFTEIEVESILRHASEKPPEAYLRWLMALRYGLRQGECLGLKFGDFDILNQTLTISRTVNSLPGKGVIELPTKTQESKRIIPIDGEVIALLLKLTQLESTPFLFAAANGLAMEATVDSRKWRALLKGAGIRYLQLHAARHTVATLLIARNVNARYVQLLLGHSSPSYTLATYVHPGVEDLRLATLGANNPRSLFQNDVKMVL